MDGIPLIIDFKERAKRRDDLTRETRRRWAAIGQRDDGWETGRARSAGADRARAPLRAGRAASRWSSWSSSPSWRWPAGATAVAPRRRRPRPRRSSSRPTRWSSSTCRPTGAARPRRDAAKVAGAFPSWPALRDGIVSRLQAPGCDTATKALKTADEAALAIFDTGSGSRANSLVLVDTGKDHPNPKQVACGSLTSTYVGKFLAIGQPESLLLADKLAQGKGGQSLADAPGPKAQFAKLPDDRVADGWLSADGIRRLLAPQGGLLGAAGVLFDQAALKGAAFGVSAHDDQVKLDVESQLDPKLKTGANTGSGFKPFKPALVDDVPDSAMAYLGVSNLAPALQRLLAAAGTSSATLKPLVGPAQQAAVEGLPGRGGDHPDVQDARAGADDPGRGQGRGGDAQGARRAARRGAPELLDGGVGRQGRGVHRPVRDRRRARPTASTSRTPRTGKRQSGITLNRSPRYSSWTSAGC